MFLNCFLVHKFAGAYFPVSATFMHFPIIPSTAKPAILSGFSAIAISMSPARQASVYYHAMQVYRRYNF